MAVSECTKLKGVYWPGMDIFDSATPEMRRKRNQKKDSSVVEQLELNSQEVEATEMIFTPQGSFKKQRRISSSVYDDEESSPVRSESPRPFLSRPALVDMDINASRRPRQAARPPAFPYLSRSQYNNEQSGPNYIYGDQGPRKRRAFDVFQDREVSFAQPAAFNYLTAGLHSQVSPSPTSLFASYKPYSDEYHYEAKENAMPTYHQPTFDHHRQSTGYRYQAYAYGLGHDQHAFQYQNHLYMNNAYQQHTHEDVDDQRTITAPPSPSTG